MQKKSKNSAPVTALVAMAIVVLVVGIFAFTGGTTTEPHVDYNQTPITEPNVPEKNAPDYSGILASACKGVVEIQGYITCKEAVEKAAATVDMSAVRQISTELAGGGDRPIIYRFVFDLGGGRLRCVVVDAKTGEVSREDCGR